MAKYVTFEVRELAEGELKARYAAYPKCKHPEVFNAETFRCRYGEEVRADCENRCPLAEFLN